MRCGAGSTPIVCARSKRVVPGKNAASAIKKALPKRKASCWRAGCWCLTTLAPAVLSAQTIMELYRCRWQVGVSREGHRIQSVEVRPRRKDSGLVAWEAPWRANKTVEPSDNMRRKAHAQHTRLQRAVNADVASLHATPVAETVDNVRRQQGLAERSPRRQPSPAGSQR